jgi:hypothetical protein
MKLRLFAGAVSGRAAKALHKIIVAAAIVFLVAITFFVLGTKPQPHLLQIQYAGVTNYQSGSHLLVQYVLTNTSDESLHISGLREVKTGAGWPVYGPDMRATVTMMNDLPPGQSTTWTVGIPDYGYVWRVRFTYTKTLTKWDKMRRNCAIFLSRQKLPRLARFVWGQQAREITMPEMESRPPSWMRPPPTNSAPPLRP